MNAPQTITPERQQAAAQVGQVFNSLQSYLQSLAHTAEDGKLILTEALNDARKKLNEASYWAIQHVLMNGAPPAPAKAAAPAAPATPSNVAETIASLGDAPTGTDALPPTTPAESM